jgi:hypothetical protein
VVCNTWEQVNELTCRSRDFAERFAPPEMKTNQITARRTCEEPKPSIPNSRGGFMDTGNYRNRVLNPLAERLCPSGKGA